MLNFDVNYDATFNISHIQHGYKTRLYSVSGKNYFLTMLHTFNCKKINTFSNSWTVPRTFRDIYPRTFMVLWYSYENINWFLSLYYIGNNTNVKIRSWNRDVFKIMWLRFIYITTSLIIYQNSLTFDFMVLVIYLCEPKLCHHFVRSCTRVQSYKCFRYNRLGYNDSLHHIGFHVESFKLDVDVLRDLAAPWVV